MHLHTIGTTFLRKSCCLSSGGEAETVAAKDVYGGWSWLTFIGTWPARSSVHGTGGALLSIFYRAGLEYIAKSVEVLCHCPSVFVDKTNLTLGFRGTHQYWVFWVFFVIVESLVISAIFNESETFEIVERSLESEFLTKWDVISSLRLI